MAIASKKICLVGDFGVGKTSLIRRFVDCQFSDHYLSTVGVKISRKVLTFESEAQPVPPSLQLVIWDLEGRTQFKAIASSYLQGASGAIVVGDLTRESTLQAINGHIDLFQKVNPQGWIAIALNKADLLEEALAERSPWLTSFLDRPEVLSAFPTSAKNALNVEAAFRTVASGRAEFSPFRTGERSRGE
ncbi:MAG: Rab family GTPase [Cyanobacteria bacterium J06648_11]